MRLLGGALTHLELYCQLLVAHLGLQGVVAMWVLLAQVALVLFQIFLQDLQVVLETPELPA
jgi:hypothetical protein